MSDDTTEEELQTFPEVIQLNVGGQLFTTMLETLLGVPDTMFTGMFGGRFPIKTLKDGSYFIDRDGTHFRWILNYLRDDSSMQALHDHQVLNEVLSEARYYCIVPLVEFIEKKISRKIFFICNPNETNMMTIAQEVQSSRCKLKILSTDLLFESSKLHCDAILVSTKDALICQDLIIKYLSGGGIVVICTSSGNKAPGFRGEWFPLLLRHGVANDCHKSVGKVYFPNLPILAGVYPFKYSFPNATIYSAVPHARKIVDWSANNESLIAICPYHSGVVITINFPFEEIPKEPNMVKLVQNALLFVNEYK